MSEAVLDNLERCGPYRLAVNRLESVKTATAERQWPLCQFMPSATVDRTEWLRQFGRALAFPEHFGANFDALYDCLCDRDVLPQPALVLIFPDLAGLEEDCTDTLIAVLQAAADEWREQGRRLWALFTAPGLDLDPLPQR